MYMKQSLVGIGLHPRSRVPILLDSIPFVDSRNYTCISGLNSMRETELYWFFHSRDYQKETDALRISFYFTFSPQGGMYWFQLVDWYGVTFSTFVTLTCGCLGLSWLYGRFHRSRLHFVRCNECVNITVSYRKPETKEGLECRQTLCDRQNAGLGINKYG
jgi:hypothetical protein